MYRTAALATVFTVQFGALAAQDVTASLREMFGRLPVGLLGTADQPALVSFGDFQAGAIAISAVPEDTAEYAQGPLGAFFRAPVAGFNNFDITALNRMPERVGFGPTDINAILSVQNPPEDALIITLLPSVVANVPDVLRANGYFAALTAGHMTFARGERDYQIDLARRDPVDPFGGTTGKSSRVAIDGDTLLQASGWPQLNMLVDEQAPELGKRDDIAAILDALDDVAPDGSALVRATLLQFQPGFAGVALPGDDAPPNGVPPWSIGLLVDLSTGREETGVIALAYPTSEMAEDAAARMATGWHETPLASDMTLAAAAEGGAKTTVSGEGPYVALLLSTVPTQFGTDQPGNMPYETMLRAMMMRELTLIGPISGG